MFIAALGASIEAGATEQSRSGLDCLPYANPGPTWVGVSTGVYGPANHYTSGSLTMQCPMNTRDEPTLDHFFSWAGYDRHGTQSVTGTYCRHASDGSSAACTTDATGGTFVGSFQRWMPIVQAWGGGYLMLTVVLPVPYSGNVSHITSYYVTFN